MAIRSAPALVVAGLFMLAGFHVVKIPTSPFGLLGEVRGGENRSLDGAASPAPAPDSGGGTVVVTVPVGSGPFGVAYDSGNGYIYVANQGTNYVSVISGTEVVGTVRVGNGPGGVAYDGGNRYVYVATPGSNNVSVISGMTVVGTVRVGTSPWDLAYDSGNGYVYVANTGSNNVSVISGTTVVGTVPVGTNPVGVGYSRGNGYVYVANFYSHSLSVINGTTVVATVRVGDYPFGVGYNSGNGYVYVSNIGSNNVSVISGTTVVGTVPVGGAPHGVGYDSRNEYVYVANFGSDTVSVFSTITPPLVTFTESGLPSGTPWSVTLHGASDSSTTTTITFSAPNGTYYFAVGGISGYTASPASAPVTVNGTPVHVAISFSVTKYAVTFNETGLPSMTSWTVTLGGARQSSTAGNITFIEPNGTYSFSVGPVAGYAVSPASGNVSVSGKATNEAIFFNAVFLGLPAMRGYALLAVIVMLVVAVGVVVALGRVSRKRRVPPSPP